MLINELERQNQEIKALVEKHGSNRAALMPILHDIHAKNSYISEHAMQMVADHLGIHPVEVNSVVSFYAFFNDKPKGKFVIRLSNDITDVMAGSKAVARQLENDLGIKFGETTPDNMFTLEYTPCIGMCDLAPAMLVNDKVYTQVTPAKVVEIIAECRGQFGVHATSKEH